MSNRRRPSAVSTAWSVAETQGLDEDIDTIHIVDSDGPEDVVRVLLEDGESEKDQVGFQATKPPGEFGDNMYREQLRNGMRELRRRISGTGSSVSESEQPPRAESDETTDTESSPIAEAQPEQNRAPEPAATGTNSTIGLSVTLDDDSLSSLQDELEVHFEEIDDSFPAESRVRELEDRVDDIDDRVRKIEETLSLLSGVGE